MCKKPNASRRKFITSGIADPPMRDHCRNASPRPGLPDQMARQYSHVEHYTKSAMACQFELLFNMHQYPAAAESALQAFALIDDFEDQMSIYIDQSELSQINRVAYQQSTLVETKLFNLLSAAREIHQKTSGAFDITSSPLSALWGFHRRDGRVPEPHEIENALQCVGMRHVTLQPESNELALLSKDAKLDLGGIGKGFAIDHAVDLLLQSGINDFVFHGGQSSVVARGSCLSSADNNDQAHGWKIGISHPQIPRCRLAEIELTEMALGTSGTQRQGFYHNGKRYGHIIDPRTGYPTDHCLSSTVICQSAARADALATAFFVMSQEEVQTFCEQNPDTSAIMVYPVNDKSRVCIEAFNCEHLRWKMLI